jgi:hypothetical protein
MQRVSTKIHSSKIAWNGQADSFAPIPGDSMKYVLLLNGVYSSAPCPPIPSASLANFGSGCPHLIHHLQENAPECLPGATGAIALVLVL